MKNTGTKFGAYWDFVQDRLIQFIALFALIWGQYQISSDINIIWLGLIYIFADSFHRVLAFHISSVRFRFGEEYFQRRDKDQLRDELYQYEKFNNNWKFGIKRWMWTRRLAILPTTIEARVLLFFFAAIFNQIFLGLLLSAGLLLGLSILRSILTVKRLYSHPDTNK